MAVDQHYENFPVASVLLPRSIRPHVVAIYRFARHADDVADEGNAAAEKRLEALASLDREVRAMFAGTPASELSLPTVRALYGLRIAYPQMTAEPFTDLLSAFAQDVVKKRYDDFPQLLDYCRRSANPVGRLMLALIQVGDPQALRASDQICSALQLINFWQDAAVDASRGRVYVPQEDFRALGQTDASFPQYPAHRALVQRQCERTLAMMTEGTTLLRFLSGRFRIEIAMTIAGGLRILEKIAANDYDVTRRPVLRWYDLPRLIIIAWTAWRRSRRQQPASHS
ncbi:MAG TPA: squalene synthase HpnC [Casimicrobium huifangae]|nr:squalene synthase HpnC [Casimicrobium huifangae]HQA33516.1 squalene synthase HpnC [Casimicrobium huifangae]HQD63920.1 squalene synthase HpnC [Casimicrobium huifangae]